MTDIYIDAARVNSVKSNENNIWTYKLNSEITLPEGSMVQVQNAFINMKGITGESIEIDEDIFETMDIAYYITEQAQHKTVNNLFNNFNNTWHRPTLSIGPDAFTLNWWETPPAGSGFSAEKSLTRTTNQTANAILFQFFDKPNTSGADSFKSFDYIGGSSQILPLCNWKEHPDGLGANKQYIEPVIERLKIYIPKGVYGISQIGQLIEDYINGIIYVEGTNLGNYKIVRTEDTKNKMENGTFDGQPYNKPAIRKTPLAKRFFNFESDAITADNFLTHQTDYFTNMRHFTEIMDRYKYSGDNSRPFKNGVSGIADNQFVAEQVIKYKIGGPALTNPMPLYHLQEGYIAENTNGGTIDDDRHYKDISYENSLLDVNGGGYGNRSGSATLIGTSNFSMSYDTTKNGFTLNGLHNVCRGYSHSRYGIKNTNSGLNVIKLKKTNIDFMENRNFGAGIATDGGKISRENLRSIIDTPETQTSGIMILNFAAETAYNDSDLNLVKGAETFKPEGRGGRFMDYFTTEEKAQQSWNKTIWKKLGFSFNQLANHNNYRNTVVYNYGAVKNYGFTTDTPLDSSTIQPSSGIYNMLASKDIVSGGGAAFVSPSIQTLGFAGRLNHEAGTESSSNILSVNGVYLGSSNYGIQIGDNVGGITAELLPTLSKHAYYLITSNIIDSYKDNVNKGDVLPICGVVPKSSLSNQDFITSTNTITQKIRNEKTINNIKIEILNPDLTAPMIDEFSSVLLKITVPYITPKTLLPPKILKEEEAGEEQQSLLGN